MKMNKCIFALALLTILVSGCGINRERKEVEKVTQDYFLAVKNKNFEQALTYYAPMFFENTNADWLKILEVINARLGDLEKYELIDWKVEKYTGSERPVGTYYVLGYNVNYSKYLAEEEFSLYKQDGSQEIKICGHDIRSPGLMEE